MANREQMPEQICGSPQRRLKKTQKQMANNWVNKSTLSFDVKTGRFSLFV